MEIHENIIQQLLGGPMHVNQLSRKFANNKGKFIQTYKQMVDGGTLVKLKQGNKIILSLGIPKQKKISFSNIMSSLYLAEKRVDEILKKLEKSKPLFIRSKFKDLEKFPLKVNPKNKRNLDKIIVVLNDLVSRSVALTYAQCLDLFSTESENIIRRYHKDCITTIQKIMNKLEKQHKESELELGSYLYYSVNGYNHLTTLLFLTKNKSSR